MSKKLLMNTNDSSLTDSIRCYDKEFTGSFITASDISPTNYIDTETIVETKNMREITEIWGNTTQDENDLSNIQSLGWWNENRKCYEFDVVSSNENLLYELEQGGINGSGELTIDSVRVRTKPIKVNNTLKIEVFIPTEYVYSGASYDANGKFVRIIYPKNNILFTLNSNESYIRLFFRKSDSSAFTPSDVKEGLYLYNTNSLISSYIASQSNKTTISLPCQLQKVGDVADRLYWDSVKGRYVVEKKIGKLVISGSEKWDSPLNFTPNSSLLGARDTSLINPNMELWGNVHMGTIKYFGSLHGVSVQGYTLTDGFSITISRVNLETEDILGLKKYLSENNHFMLYKNKSPQLTETNITSKIQLPTYIGTTHTFITDNTTDASKFTYEDKDVDILVGARPIEIFGNTVQDETDLSKIESLGVWNERRQGYEVDILSGVNSLDFTNILKDMYIGLDGEIRTSKGWFATDFIPVKKNQVIYFSNRGNKDPFSLWFSCEYGADKSFLKPFHIADDSSVYQYTPTQDGYIRVSGLLDKLTEKDYISTINEYVSSNKTTILLPCQLQKVGNVADRLYWDGVKGRYVVEKRIIEFKPRDYISQLTSHHVGDGFVDLYSISILNEFLTGKDAINNTDKIVNLPYIRYSNLKTDVTVQVKNVDTFQDAINVINQNNFVTYFSRVVDLGVGMLGYEIIETNITSKIKVPTYANKTHISFVSENGIDCSDSKVLVPYKELL